MRDSPDLFLALSQLSSAVGVLQQCADAVVTSAKVIHEARWKWFMFGCKRQLEAQGVLGPEQERQLVAIFSNEYARKHAFDFVRRAIENSSEISRLALARLYVHCASRPYAGMSIGESILMNAYRDLDDRDVKLLLTACHLCWPDVNLSAIDSGDSVPRALEMTRDQFADLKADFQPVECSSVFDLRDSMEQFATRRVFESARGLIGSSKGDAFELYVNQRTVPFIEGLVWAKGCLNAAEVLNEQEADI